MKETPGRAAAFGAACLAVCCYWPHLAEGGTGTPDGGRGVAGEGVAGGC